MFFSIQTKILTNTLVTFKRWDGVKDEKFKYFWGSLKNLILMRGSRKTTIQWGLPKKRAWTVKGTLGEKEGGSIFDGG